MKRPHTFLTYHVAPRYTAGSPAQVTEIIARMVAKEEEDAHSHTRAGFYGRQERERAEQMGLGGIAWMMQEKGNRIILTDLITRKTVTLTTHEHTTQHIPFRVRLMFASLESRT